MNICRTINFKKVTIILLLSSLLILVSTVAIASSTSQPWSNTYGGQKDDSFNSVIQTSDGGYAAVGYTSPYANNTTTIYFVKTNANGTLQWNNTYGGEKEAVGYGVVQTSDGGYAIAGYDILNNSAMMAYLLRIDSNGNMLWNKTFGSDDQDGAYSIAKTSDGGFILTGFTYVYDSGGWDAFLIKTDAQGNVTWDRNYGGLFKDAGHSVEQTSDGGYIFTGYTKSYGVLGGDANGVGAENLWLVKVDANGTEQWNKTFGGYDYDDGFAVDQLSDGGYIVAGTTKSFYSNGTLRPAYDVNDTARAYLIRTDANGNEIWHKTYGGNHDTAIFSMDVVQDGFVLAGTTFSDRGDADLLALKASLNGTGEWGYTYGGSEDDYGYSICPADDGYVIAGNTKSFGSGGTDGYLIRISDNGSGPSTINNPGTNTENQPGQGTPFTYGILVTVIIACVAIAALVIWKWILRK